MAIANGKNTKALVLGNEVFVKKSPETAIGYQITFDKDVYGHNVPNTGYDHDSTENIYKAGTYPICGTYKVLQDATTSSNKGDIYIDIEPNTGGYGWVSLDECKHDGVSYTISGGKTPTHQRFAMFCIIFRRVVLAWQ